MRCNNPVLWSTKARVWNAGKVVLQSLISIITRLALALLVVMPVYPVTTVLSEQETIAATTGSSKTPFDISHIIEKAEHLIQRDPAGLNRYWAEDPAYQVEFTPDTVTYYQKRDGIYLDQLRLQFMLESIRVPEEVIYSGLSPSSVRVEENRLIYQRTPIIKELYEARREGVEQSWIIDRPLSDKPGDVIVQGKILTSLSSHPNKEGGIDFIDKEGRYITSYGKVVVLDNAGRRLTISPVYQNTRIVITVPSEWMSQATYPVVIDPLIGSNIQVDSLAATDNYPAIAFDGINYLIVWQSGTPNATGTGTTAIKGVRVSSSGTVLDATPLNIGDTANQDDESPSVTYDSLNSRYILVWMTWNSTTSANIWRNTVNIWDGVPGDDLGTATNILAGGTTILAYPAVVCCDVNNNYYVVYGQSGTGTTNFTQYTGQTYNRTTHAAATVSNPTATVSSGTITPDTEPRSAPRLYSLSSTMYLLTWETFDIDANGDVSANMVRVTTTPGYTWGTQVSVAATVGTLERYPRSAFDGTNALIVYQQGATTTADIYGRFVTPGPSSLTLGTTVTISTVAGSGQMYPDVAYTTGTCSANPINRYMVVWQDYRNSATNPDIYGAPMSTAGTVETEIAISTNTTYIKERPVITADSGSCGYMVAWSDNRNSGTTSSDIYAQRVGYPNINSLNPTSQSQGNTVSINGMNFGADPGVGNRSTATNNVKLGVTQITDTDIVAWIETPSPRIDFRVPAISPGTYQVTVTAGSWTSNSSSLTVTDPLQITTSILPYGYQWLQYTNTTLTASGGTPPYSNWLVVIGALPDGLNLDSNTGTISGTPTGIEMLPTEDFKTYSFTVRVSDSVSSTATKDLSITVYKLTAITVTPATPTITQGQTIQFTATGTYSDTTTSNITTIVTWSSSNSAVATVNATGLATGVGLGSVTISATK